MKWLSKQPKLLRRMLGWPLLWRLAANAALSLPHDANDAHCLPCAAKERAKRDQHRLTMNTKRQLTCRECGLPLGDWKSKPLCRHKPLWPAPPPKESSSVAVFPLNW